MTVRTDDVYKASKCMMAAFNHLSLYKEDDNEIVLVSRLCPDMEGSFDEWSIRIQDSLGIPLIVRISGKYLYWLEANDIGFTTYRVSIIPNKKWEDGWFDIGYDGTSGLTEYIIEYRMNDQVCAVDYYNPAILDLFNKMGVESHFVYDIEDG